MASKDTISNEQLKMRNGNHYSFLIPHFSFLIIMILASCQTAPKTPDFSLVESLPLEPGGYVYMIAGKDAVPVLNELMLNNLDNKQFQQMVDRTQFIAAAIYITPKLHYRLAAWGNYPASRANMALNTSKEWIKRRSTVSGADYWHSPEYGYSVAISPGMALVATSAALIDPFSAAPGIAIPEGFNTFRKIAVGNQGSILSCWLADPGAAINQKLGVMGIPLELPAQQLFVSLYPAENQETGDVLTADAQRYIARLQIQVANESLARALPMMFAIARNFFPPQTDINNPIALLPSVLFANPPEQDGSNLNITTAPLTAQEIALLLKMFSI